MADNCYQGRLSKMRVDAGEPIQYYLDFESQPVNINELIGRNLSIHFTGNIHCSNCNRLTKKSFSQGYCYPCMMKLARCDQCILKPETCHFDQGTCREPDWAESNCFVPHIVYLANSSGTKVGITRASQMPTRWIDQGAVAALPIFEVSNRKASGLMEVIYKSHVADKTNWRKMLKHEVEDIDLLAVRDNLYAQCDASIKQFERDYPQANLKRLADAIVSEFSYPHLEWPSKIVSFNLDKQDTIEGTLIAIKGQYLIFDTGCLNVRKFTSYNVRLTVH